MLLVLIDEAINIGIVLFKNRKPLGGQTVSARVVDQFDGAELLPATNIPETAETGVYNFEWNRLNVNPPPLKSSDLQALFTVKNEVFAELIQVRTRGFIVSDLKGEMFDNELLVGQINDGDGLAGSIDEAGGLSGSIEESEELTGAIDDTDTLKGEI